MNRRQLIVSLVLAGGSTAFTPTFAAVPTTQPQDANQQLIDGVTAMQKRLDVMQSQLAQTQDQLKQTQSRLAAQQQIAPVSHAASVQQTPQDSDRHIFASTDDGLVAGFDPRRGFFISADNGNSYLHAGMLFQGQPSANLSRDRSLEATGNVQFDIDGNLFTRDLTFDFQINQGGNGPTVEVAEGTYIFDRTFWNHRIGVEVGQFKNPVFKQSSQITDWNQLFVERSLVEDQIGGGQYGQQIRATAIQFLGDDSQPLRASLFGYDGDTPGGQAITPVGSPQGSIGTRVDYKLYGHWDDTTDLTDVAPWRTDLLVFGGGLTYENYDDAHGIRLSADGQYQVAQRWTLFGAAYYDHFDMSDGVAGTRNDFGLLGEGGYLILPQLQVVGRYSFTRLSPAFTTEPGRSIFYELGVGANYYLGPNGSWASHAKVSLDLDYLPNGSPPNDILYTATATSEVVLRGQVQLQF